VYIDSHSSFVILIHDCYCRERDLQRQLTLTKDQLRDLRASNESNEAKLIDQSERQGAASSHTGLTKQETNHLCRPGSCWPTSRG
jgi:hypothetical protein